MSHSCMSSLTTLNATQQNEAVSLGSGEVEGQEGLKAETRFCFPLQHAWVRLPILRKLH